MATSSFDKDFIVTNTGIIAALKRKLKNMKRGDNVDYTDELANYLGFDNDDYTVEDVSKEALKIIKDLQSDPWISVDDELPNVSFDYYLCMVTENCCETVKKQEVLLYISSIKCFSASEGYTVTHWMPLPQVPEVKHE